MRLVEYFDLCSKHLEPERRQLSDEINFRNLSSSRKLIEQRWNFFHACHSFCAITRCVGIVPVFLAEFQAMI